MDEDQDQEFISEQVQEIAKNAIHNTFSLQRCLDKVSNQVFSDILSTKAFNIWSTVLFTYTYTFIFFE